MTFSFLKRGSAAIDLGSNIRIYKKDEGIFLNEAFVGLKSKKSGKITEAGNEAKRLFNFYPEEFTLVEPFLHKDSCDMESFEKILGFFINKISPKSVLKPDIILTASGRFKEDFHSDIKSLFLGAGCRSVSFVNAQSAAAMGAGFDISGTEGVFCVNIGEAFTDMGVMVLGNTLLESTLNIGGKDFDKSIADYIREKYSLSIGKAVSEKFKFYSGENFSEERNFEVKGRDLLTGLPKSIEINKAEIKKAYEKPIKEIVLEIKRILGEIPKELLLDVSQKGILFTGGGSLIPGIKERAEKETGIKVVSAESPFFCAAKGAGMCIKD